MEQKQIALLSNITPDMIKLKLSKSFDIYIPSGFNAWIPEIFNNSSYLYDDSIDSIVILLDGSGIISSEEADNVLDGWQNAITFLSKNTSKPILVSTLDIHESKVRTLSEVSFSYEKQNKWADFLKKITEDCSNVYIFDLAEKIADIGRNNFYSNKMLYLGSMPYSKTGIQAICEEITLCLNSIFCERKKIVVLDLDNTLWGGVIGEDGADGILLSNHKEGKRYYDFQYQFKRMKERGVLLAIASKNNEEDVQPVFEKSDMILKNQDFVAKKINWNTKSSNIKEIESDLNITEGGFIFIDDNPVERNIVKGECSSVMVPEFPEDTTTLLEFAEDLYIANLRLPRLLNEDKKKTEMYFSAAKRGVIKKISANLEDYISTLEINVDIHKAQPNELARVAQLCNKTNQFNLTTKRYSESDVQQIYKQSDTDIFVTYVNDKYGDDGLTSVLIIKKGENDIIIDTFLMSCRVMGRKIENAIINNIIRFYANYKKIIATYLPTSKNKPVANLYEQLGFTLISQSETGKNYELPIVPDAINRLSCFKSIKFNGDLNAD